MTAVSVSLLSPGGPDLTNATTAEILTALFKAFGIRPFVPEEATTCNRAKGTPYRAQYDLEELRRACGARTWVFNPPRLRTVGGKVRGP